MKITREQLAQIINEELVTILREDDSAAAHPQAASELGHPLVVDANAKFIEALKSLEALDDAIEEEGIDALGSMMDADTTLADIQMKIRSIFSVAKYMGWDIQ
jgi:hypothetical protein